MVRLNRPAVVRAMGRSTLGELACPSGELKAVIALNARGQGSKVIRVCSAARVRIPSGNRADWTWEQTTEIAWNAAACGVNPTPTDGPDVAGATRARPPLATPRPVSARPQMFGHARWSSRIVLACRSTCCSSPRAVATGPSLWRIRARSRLTARRRFLLPIPAAKREVIGRGHPAARCRRPSPPRRRRQTCWSATTRRGGRSRRRDHRSR